MGQPIEINLDVDINETTKDMIQKLRNRIKALETSRPNQSDLDNIQTGVVLAFCGPCEIIKTKPDGKISVEYKPAPEGYEWCFGAIVDRTNPKYSNLYNYIGTTYNRSDDNLPENKFRLPDYSNVFQRGYYNKEYADNNQMSIRWCGQLQDCGLPNIKGQFNANGDDGTQWDGPFYYVSSLSTGNGGSGGGKISFDASRVSSVYQNGLTEVRPNNKIVNYIIKL